MTIVNVIALFVGTLLIWSVIDTVRDYFKWKAEQDRQIDELRRPGPHAPLPNAGVAAAVSGGRPGVVKLGPQQREMARNLFPESKDPDLEYAKNMTLEERKRGPV